MLTDNIKKTWYKFNVLQKNIKILPFINGIVYYIGKEET